MAITAFLAMLASATPAAAAYRITVSESAEGVVFTSSGSLNLSGLTFREPGAVGGGINPVAGAIGLGSRYDYYEVDFYQGLSFKQGKFGDGGGQVSSYGSGPLVGASARDGLLLVPRGYRSGGNLGDSEMTFLGATFASLGLRTGEYSFDLGSVADELWLSIGAVPASVPEPATWLAMLAGFGAIGFALRRRRERLALVPHPSGPAILATCRHRPPAGSPTDRACPARTAAPDRVDRVAAAPPGGEREPVMTTMVAIRRRLARLACGAAAMVGTAGPADAARMLYSYIEPISGDSVLVVSSGPIDAAGIYAAASCTNAGAVCDQARVSLTNLGATFLSPYPSSFGNPYYGYFEPVLSTPGTYDNTTVTVVNARLAVRALNDDDFVYSYVEPASGDAVVVVSSGPLAGNGTYAAANCVNNHVLCGNASVLVTNLAATFLNPYPSYPGNRSYGYFGPVLTTPGTYDNSTGLTINARLVVIGVAAVPEPGTWAMAIIGFLLIGSILRKRRPTGRLAQKRHLQS